MAKIWNSRRRYTTLLDVVAILAIGLVPFLWFPFGTLVNGNDTSYPLEASAWVYDRLFAWGTTENGGGDIGSQIGGLIWHALQAVLQTITSDPGLAEKCFFSFWFTAAGLAMYVGVRWYTRSRTSAYIATAVYMLNPFLMTGAMWENASAANIPLYVIFPFLFFIFLATAEGRIPCLLGAALFGLAAFLAGPFGMLPPLQIAFLIQVALAVAFLLITTKRSEFRRIYRALAALSVAFVAVSAYWIFPLGEYVSNIASQTGGSLSLTAMGHSDWLAGISSHTSIPVVARLLGAWDFFASWHGENYNQYSDEYLHNPIMLLLGFLLPVLAYSSLFIVRRPLEKRLASLCAVSAIIFTVLSAGAHGPTGPIYLSLYRSLPGFNVIRSPWFMFEAFTVFNYAVLLGLGLRALFRDRALNNIKPLAAFMVITAIAVYAYPLVTGSFLKPFRQETPGFVVRYPGYVSQAAKFIETNTQGRYLCLPLTSAGYIYRWRGGAFASGVPLLRYVANNDLAFTFPGEGATSSAPFDSMLRHALVDILAENRAAAGDLNLLGIETIVVQMDQWFDFSGSTIAPEVWDNAVRSIPGARRVATYGPWRIYSLSHASPVEGNFNGVAGDIPTSLLGAWHASSSGSLPLLQFDPGTPTETFDRVEPSLHGTLSDRSYVSGKLAPYFEARRPGLLHSYVGLLSNTEAEHSSDLFPSRIPARAKSISIMGLDGWYRNVRRLRAFDAPPSDVAVAGSSVQMSIRYIDGTHGELIFSNPGRLVSSVDVIIDGGDVRPEDISNAIASWDGTVMQLRVPPGDSILRLRYSSRFNARIVDSEAIRPPWAPNAPRATIARDHQDVVVKLFLSANTDRAEGVVIPIASSISINSDPIVQFKAAQTNASVLNVALLVTLVSMDGTSSRELVPIGDEPISITNAINAAYIARWHAIVRRNQLSSRWRMLHRIPPRVQGATISELALLIEKPAGVRASVSGPALLRVSDLSLSLASAYQPQRQSISYDLSPATARWVGLKGNVSSSVHVESNGILLDQNLGRDVGAAVSEAPEAPEVGGAYAVVLSSGHSYEAVLQSRLGDWYNWQMRDGSRQLVNKSAIISLSPSSLSGAITITKSLALPLSYKNLLFTFAPTDSDQRISFQLVFKTEGRTKLISFSDDMSQHGSGIYFQDVSDLTTSQSAQSLLDEVLGVSAIHTVNGARLLSVDLEDVKKSLGIDTTSTLASFSLEIRAARHTFTVGHLTLTRGIDSSDARGARSNETQPGLEQTPSGYAVVNPQKGETQPIKFTAVNPSCWVIDATRVAKPFILTFAQNYNRGWQAVADPANVGCSHYFAFGPKGGQILPHFRADGYKNAWVVDGPREHTRIVLFFRPQGLLDFAFAVTTFAVSLFIVIVLVFVARKYRSAKSAA